MQLIIIVIIILFFLYYSNKYIKIKEGWTGETGCTPKLRSGKNGEKMYGPWFGYDAHVRYVYDDCCNGGIAITEDGDYKKMVKFDKDGNSVPLSGRYHITSEGYNWPTSKEQLVEWWNRGKDAKSNYLFKKDSNWTSSCKFVKKPKNTNCLHDTIITEKSECQKAIANLGLKENSWWTGNTANIPAGCTWRDYTNADAHWNTLTTSAGKPRHDLHPICKIGGLDCVMNNTWTPWGTCTKICGNGTQRRTRGIAINKFGTGKECPPNFETKNCNTFACKDNCIQYHTNGQCKQCINDGWHVRENGNCVLKPPDIANCIKYDQTNIYNGKAYKRSDGTQKCTKCDESNFWFLDNNQCKKNAAILPQNCEQLGQPYQDKAKKSWCARCKNGYYFSGVKNGQWYENCSNIDCPLGTTEKNGKCEMRNINKCLDYTDESRTDCSKCENGYKLINNGHCDKIECNEKEHMKDELGNFIIENEICKKNECPQGFKFDYNYEECKPIADCAYHQFVNENGKCEDVSCNWGKKFMGNDNQGLPICKDVSCNWDEEFDKTGYKCVKIPCGYGHIIKNNECVPLNCHLVGQKLDDNSGKKCIPSTQIENCSRMSGKNCENCDTGYTLDITKKKCNEIELPNCSKQLNRICYECLPGYNLENDNTCSKAPNKKPSFQGDRGERGDIGDQGYQGERGDQGPRGLTGLTGCIGGKGSCRGVKGADGPQGARGVRGRKGYRGERGERGDKGIQSEINFHKKHNILDGFKKILDNVGLLAK